MVTITTTPAPFQPGFRLIDGTALNAAVGAENLASTDAIVASTTQTRLGGTAVKTPVSRVSSANNLDAVTLGGAGAVLQTGFYIIANKSGQTIQVFPPGANDTIDGGAAGAAVQLSNAKLGLYIIALNNGGVLTISSGSMAVSS